MLQVRVQVRLQVRGADLLGCDVLQVRVRVRLQVRADVLGCVGGWGYGRIENPKDRPTAGRPGRLSAMADMA